MSKLTSACARKEKKIRTKISLFNLSPEEPFGMFSQIWKDVLKSNLTNRDKAEIIRFLIFALTVTAVIALFVLNEF